jgi:hypothetical protein
MNRSSPAARALCLTVAAFLLSGACASRTPCDVRWDPVVAYEGDAAFERIRAGRPDASDPNLQLVGVDQAGVTVLVRMDGDRPRSEVIYRHGCELTGLAIADVDPSVPGEEIYVGGYAAGTGREGTGGAVVQIAITPDGPRTRRVFEGTSYVHSIEAVLPQKAGDPVRLLVTNYAGELHVSTPAAGEGTWPSSCVFRDTGTTDVEALKIKDAAFLRDPAGRTPHEVLVVSKTGRTHLVDLDRPAAGKMIHFEEGGLARVEADPAGGAYVCGYYGRAMHFQRDGEGFRVVPLDHEGKESGLRGFVPGRFPVPGGEGTFAVFGFHKLCRVLTPRNGAYDTTTIYADTERGHTLLAADVVPGNDADELVLGGYSKRITILVARR